MLKNWLRSKILFLISIAAVFLISIHTPVTSDTTLIPSVDESIIISSSKLSTSAIQDMLAMSRLISQ